MMRSATLHRRLVESLRQGNSGFADMATQDVARLPVTVRDEAKKKALLKELGAIDRQHRALMRRVRAAAVKLERLPVVKTALKTLVD